MAGQSAVTTARPWPTRPSGQRRWSQRNHLVRTPCGYAGRAQQRRSGGAVAKRGPRSLIVHYGELDGALCEDRRV
jgi:hypothetical protein